MRQQLINWLSEDIIPGVQSGQTPEDVMLKFARAQNLTPALLESLGQLYNTAKTLSHLDQSVKRGSSFPIVDVPALVDKYMEVEAPKKASFEPQWEGDLDETESLPECLRQVLNPSNSTISGTLTPAAEDAATKLAQAAPPTRAALEQARQELFDAEETARESLDRFVKRAAQDPEFNFAPVESDVLYLHGDAFKPVVELAVKFLKSAHLPVTRSADAGPRRLVNVTGHLSELLCLGGPLERLQQVKKAMQELEVQHRLAFPDEMEGGGDSSLDLPAEVLQERAHHPQRPRSFSEPPAGSPPAGGQSSGGKGSGGSETGYFDSLNNKLDAGAGQMGSFAGGRILKMLEHPDNDDQRQVDHGFEETRQLAMLQSLMLNDSVLSEADPERVVEVFNSIRQYAPSLARDPNVMRVALRSAVQHDGISPFDVKSLIDTELSGQKAEANRQAFDDQAYSGASAKQPK